MKFLTLLIINFFDFFHKRKILKFFYSKKIYNFDVIFDIGAHKGETILYFNKYFSVNNIYAFEPSPLNFKILKKNIQKTKLKNLTRIHLENFAVGEVLQKKTLLQMSESSSSTFKEINLESKYFKIKNKFLGKLIDNSKKIKVDQIKLEDYIKNKNLDNLDLLKVDTEGSEFEVLKGLGEYLGKFKIILFEHHYDNMIVKGYKFSDIHNLLTSKNYQNVFKIKMPFRKTFEYIYFRNFN
tara:strand:- start:377 stop:1093 length:717 start_codon:yes stop_codon:yes gene_type:complete